MRIERGRLAVGFTGVCAFLLGALCLIVSSGYSYGPALLLLAALPLLVSKLAWPKIGREELLLIAVLALFMLVWIAEVLLTGQGSRELDKPSRFLAAILAFFWILRFPPRAVFVWLGITVGSIGAAGLAVWERFFEGAWRVSGYTHPIQFGNISMLLGLLCLAALGWALNEKKKGFWVALLLLGFVAGFFASLLSGSRGGWIGLPFVFLILYRCYKPWLKPIHVTAFVFTVVTLVTTVYLVPQTGVKARVMQAIESVEKYNSGDANTSVGARFEMWKAAALMISERPLTGWGLTGYRAQLEVLSAEGVVPTFINQFGHAHNEFLDVFAKRGVLGLLALMALYFLPLKMFLAKATGNNPVVHATAAGGAVLCVAYIDFSLSQSFLSHNSGVMVFTFYLVIFWGVLRSQASNVSDGHVAKLKAI